MDSERLLRIVRGHVPLRVPEEVQGTALTASVAMVLSTYRSDVDGMVLDHDLWMACMDAVTRTVQGRTSEVFGVPERRILDEYRRQRRGASLGTLREYGERLRTEASRGDEDGEDWHTILWWNAGAIVASASCEPWYAVGGPAPYHDSYTTSVLVDPSNVETLIREIITSVRDAGGTIDGVANAQRQT